MVVDVVEVGASAVRPVASATHADTSGLKIQTTGTSRGRRSSARRAGARHVLWGRGGIDVGSGVAGREPQVVALVGSGRPRRSAIRGQCRLRRRRFIGVGATGRSRTSSTAAAARGRRRLTVLCALLHISGG